VRLYQRIIKLKYRASRYLSMFSFNRPMCLYKSQTHVYTSCKFQLSSDREKNPGPTPMYIDLGKTIRAPYRVGIWTKFRTTCCHEVMLWLTITNKESILLIRDLVSIINIGNQLYSCLSQLTRQSFLMQTEWKPVVTSRFAYIEVVSPTRPWSICIHRSRFAYIEKKVLINTLTG